MPPSALALVILAGLIHACWNIAAKKAGGDVRFSCFSSLVMMVFWAPVGLWLGWQQVPAWGVLEWSLVSASGILHTIYFVVLLRGYRKADLTLDTAGETYVLAMEVDGWSVYFAERGSRVDEMRFETEDEACHELLLRLTRDPTTRKF